MKLSLLWKLSTLVSLFRMVEISPDIYLLLSIVTT